MKDLQTLSDDELNALFLLMYVYKILRKFINEGDEYGKFEDYNA